jgi:hypothetical protein
MTIKKPKKRAPKALAPTPTPPRRIPAQLDPLYQIRHKLPIANQGDALKHSAICKMHLGVPLHQISAEMQIPMAHLRLWAKQEHITKPEVPEAQRIRDTSIAINWAIDSVEEALLDFENTMKDLDTLRNKIDVIRESLTKIRDTREHVAYLKKARSTLEKL